MNLKRNGLAVGILASLVSLTACTGVDDEAQYTRLALLYEGGKTLAYTTLEDKSTSGTLEGVQNIGDGIDLLGLPDRENVLLTRKAVLEQRDLKLENPKSLPALPFAPCLARTVMNYQQTYVMTLSACENKNEQQVGMYSRINNYKLMWTAELPPSIAPSSQDRPPVNLGLIDSIGLVTRPVIGGNETMRISPRDSGDSEADKKGVVSAPADTGKIWDVSFYNDELYAATDKGIRPILNTGLPNAESFLKPFGEVRWDRIWGEQNGSQNLLAAWREDTRELVVWDNNQSDKAYQRVGYFNKVSDLVVAGDSYMYVLADNKLLRFDIFRGLRNGNWRQRTMIQELKDPKALAWMNY